MSGYRNVAHSNTLVGYTEKLASELFDAGRRRTAKAYRSAAARLVAFTGGGDLCFEELSQHLLYDFQRSLQSQGRGLNTVSFYMRTLRAIYRKASSEGRLTRPPDGLFAGVYTGVSPTRKRALSHSELTMLSALDPTSKPPPGGGRRRVEELPDNLAGALALFLFCYHARGMSFVDAAYLRKSDLVGGQIRYRRSKTGRPIEVHVLPVMKRIIDWFAPQTAGSRYLFPILDESRGDLERQYESGLRLQNLRLKRIASRLGIAKRLSTHSARHSWATVAKSTGVPLAVISEGLGHSNQRTTEIYLASLDRSILDRAAKVVSEAIFTTRRPKHRGLELRL
jgi:integrase